MNLTEWMINGLMLAFGAAILIALLRPGAPRRPGADGLLPPWLGGLLMALVGAAQIIAARAPDPLTTANRSYLINAAWLSWILIAAITAAVRWLARRAGGPGSSGGD